ncbi:MAG: DUF6438 domain-containing protein [Acidobacteriota bacterium]
MLLLFATLGHAQVVEDSITLERTPCLGTCPAYSLRIDSSGNVSFQDRQPEVRSVVDPTAFRTLIAEFERIEFFEFNTSYEATYTDGPGALVGVTLAGKSKMVSHWNVAPPGLEELERMIERFAKVHGRLHSDRRNLTLQFPLSRTFTLGGQMGGKEDLKNADFVQEDAYRRIKPGMTPLIQAAFSGNVVEIRRLVARGDDVNAADETGWTALMYAAVTTPAGERRNASGCRGACRSARFSR